MFTADGLAVLLKSLMGKENHEQLQRFIADGVFTKIVEFVDRMEQMNATLTRVEGLLNEVERRARIAADIQSGTSSEYDTTRRGIEVIDFRRDGTG